MDRTNEHEARAGSDFGRDSAIYRLDEGKLRFIRSKSETNLQGNDVVGHLDGLTLDAAKKRLAAAEVEENERGADSPGSHLACFQAWLIDLDAAALLDEPRR